jgi:SPP1 gp7 family putative phage head morphogenesis protein
MYVQDSYKRGVIRSRYELGKAGMGVPTMEKSGGISASMSTPFHMDRVGILYARVFEDLKGITSQMDSAISRILSQGIIDGDNPKTLVKKLTDATGISRNRARTLARTEVIRAHHLGTVQEYRNWGLSGVKVQAEWSTAGFNVCPDCASMEGKIFTLDQIEGMIPRHPNCRCMILPVLNEKGVKTVEKVKEEAIKENIFTPAGTIEDVQKRMINAGVTKVKLDGLSLEYVNSILQAIEKEALSKGFKLAELVTYKKSNSFNVALYSPSNNSISINTSKLKALDKTLKEYKVVSYEDQLIKAENSIQFIKDNYLGNPKYKQSTVFARLNAFNNDIYQLKKKIKAGEIARPHTVSYTTGNSVSAIQSTVYHELGHYRMYKTWKDQSYSWSTLRSISEYGRTNQVEYFAEWYSQYRTYGEKGVPEDLLKMFKSI